VLDRARAPAAGAGRVVVVEGYTDVLTLHQAGITEAVAIMGTAFTQQQLAELPYLAKTVYLALDADRAGQEAMLRAARGAKDRDLELLVVGMPDGTDPADLVADQGVEAFADLVDRAMTVPEFEARRVLADADLGTPRGRDRALERIRPLIESTAPNSATRQELVRFVADRVDVPTHYLMTTPATTAPAPPAGGNGSAPRADLDLIAKRERIFLSMCLGDPVSGRDYLGRLTDEHLSSDRLRGVRDWLIQHFDDPLEGLPADDPSLSAAVSEVVLADEGRPTDSVLRVTFLQLDLRRIERALRHAEQDADLERQMGLSRERTAVRSEINDLMGEPE
jgi:DNA primase